MYTIVDKTSSVNFLKSVDYFLFAMVLVFTAFGIVVLKSATYTMDFGEQIVKRQILFFAVGIVVCIIISLIDYEAYKVLGLLFYSISVLLLVAVIFWGIEAGGSKRWLDLPVMGVFQPSEITKIAYIIVAAKSLEKVSQESNRSEKLKSFGVLLILSCIPVFLIVIQPDAGTAVVFLCILFAMVFMSGFPLKYILAITGVGTLLIPVTWLFILEPYQKLRIMSFLQPEQDPLGAGFHVIRSKMAIGSGQFFGKGLFNGVQTQSGSVPVRESDFIFTVIGEELGFIGTAGVVMVILFILVRCLVIANNARDMYGALLVVGLSSMMAFHFFQNIGMNIGLLPVTGVPLPFISAGGSAMVTNYISIGIILSVSARKRRTRY